MKIVIVNCFETNEDRVDLIHDFFTMKGYEVKVIQSDFKHIMKVKRTKEKKDFIFIETKPYYKNLSIQRMLSHYYFAKKAFKLVENYNPNFIYAILPPNSIAKFAAKYKRKHSKVKLLFDLMDLWTESLPIGKIKEYPPFSFWKKLRDKNLKYANQVITECDLYQEVLKNQLINIKVDTLYLAKRDEIIESKLVINDDNIHLCYLGSINNIIDISRITKLVKAINAIKPVTVHIIGDGESKDILLKEVKSTGANVEFYGKIYDTQKKQEIFNKCYFGLNIMKETVCVGLTMKSIDYFRAGLPIINTIEADTQRIVEKNNTGFNLIGNSVQDIAQKVAASSIDDIKLMKKNTRKTYENLFSVKAFEAKLENILKK
jgi:glycosyltransferase involved in cell wall biosynthesis